MNEESNLPIMESPRAPMSEADKLKLVIAFLVLILFVIGVYYFLHKKPATVTTSEQPAPGQNQQTPVFDWTAHRAEVVAAFKDAFSASDFQTRGDAQILHAVDLTGDGVPEAFVDLGAGGASNELIGLAGVMDGHISVLNFRMEDGTLAPVQLIEGAAALHKDNVGVSVDDHAIYQGEVMYDSATGKQSSCTATAYQWNATTHVFEYNADLGTRLAPEYCAQVPTAQQ